MWLTWDARLNTPDDKGVTVRESLNASANKPRMSKWKLEAMSKLTPPCEFPEELDYIERIARDVANRAGHGANGRQRPSNAELQAHLQLRGLSLFAHEIDGVLTCADIIVFGSVKKERAPDAQKKETPGAKTRGSNARNVRNEDVN